MRIVRNHIVSLFLLWIFLTPVLVKAFHKHEFVFYCSATNDKHFHIYHELCAICAFNINHFTQQNSNVEHGNRYEIGNDQLNPENAYESDCSMHYHREFFSFDLAVFYNNIDNYIYISSTGETLSTGMNIYRFSQTNAKLYGGEAGVNFHPRVMPWLHIKGVYSSVTAKQDKW